MMSLQNKYRNYHYCIVRECKNTTIKTQKLWIQVPSDRREAWLKAAKRDPKALSTESRIYFCEDHFDLQNDMENYMEYKIMGYVKKIIMKKDCVPTRFECQAKGKRKHQLTPVKDAIKKRVCLPNQSTSLLQVCEETRHIPTIVNQEETSNIVHCCVMGCDNVEVKTEDGSPQNVFFSFPNNEKLCRQWAAATGRRDLALKDVKTLHKSYHICNRHFHTSVRCKSKSLRVNAIPTVNLPNTCHYRTVDTQTDVEVDETKLDETGSLTTSDEIDAKHSTTGDDLSLKSDSEFVVAQHRIQCILMKLKESNPGVASDNVEYKKLLLKLYLSSPLAYILLYKTFKLPDEDIIRQTNIDVIGCKLSYSMVKCLKYKGNRLNNSERVCVVSVTLMSLGSEITMSNYRKNERTKQQEHVGKTVVVLMARGLLSEWKQPISYFFISNDIDDYPAVAEWVKEILTQMKSIGFDVVAVTTDIDNLFFNLNKKRSGKSSQNIDTSICYVYDVPHLLISLRNILMKRDVSFCDGNAFLQASWDDIVKIYKLEKINRFRVAEKLTENHIKPSAIEKESVQLAAEVFSRSTAAAITCNIGPRKLSVAALGTATLAYRLNNVFDILNSAENSSSNYKSKFTGDSSQLKYLQGFVNLLNTLRVVKVAHRDVTRHFTLDNFKRTIKSILLLSKKLKKKGFDYFYTRRLSVAEGFIKIITKYPTSQNEFHRKFKKQFLNSAIDTQKVDMANEINILFSAIDFMYVEICNPIIRDFFNIDRSSQSKQLTSEIEQHNLSKIESDDDGTSASESEEETEDTNQRENRENANTSSGSEDDAIPTIYVKIKAEESLQDKAIDVEFDQEIKDEGDENNESKINEEIVSMHNDIQSIMNAKDGVLSIDDIDNCIAYSVLEVENSND